MYIISQNVDFVKGVFCTYQKAGVWIITPVVRFILFSYVDLYTSDKEHKFLQRYLCILYLES